MSRTRLTLLALLAPLLLAGCQADVQTRIQVSEQAQATVTVSAEFRGDAARALDDNMVSDVEAIFTERGAQRVQTQREGERVTVSAVVDYESLTKSSDVTGVASAELQTTEDTGTVMMRVVRPAALVKALTDQAERSAADPADAEALAATFLATTSISVVIRFPGATSVDPDQAVGPFVSAQANEVVFSAPLAEMRDGAFTVTGDLQPPRHLLWWALGAVVLGGIAVSFLMRRG